MIKNLGPEKLLVSFEDSGAIDREALQEWAFNTFSLIETAGRNCAMVLGKTYPEIFGNRKSFEGRRF